MSLSGKVALVTGGSRGIGAAIALRLAQLGADVAITYSNASAPAEKVVADIKALGRKAIAIKANAASEADLNGLLAKVVKDFGHLDILVNNAGIFDAAPISEITLERFDKTMAVNVRALFQLIQQAAEILPKGGRIINIGSVLGERVGLAGMTAYSTSKFAVSGLTRAAAHDLAPRGILVNNVQPGPINTDMNPEDGAFAEAMKSMVPLKRYGRPEEVAEIVAFLAGPGATYITATSIEVDGGLEA